MRNFKTSSLLLSFMAVLSLMVLFTSCSKEDITTEIEETATITNQEEAIKILLPEEITSKGEEAVKEYLQNMSDAQKVKHINDYTIGEYLTRKGKIKDLDPNGEKIGLPQDLNLSDHLTGDEIEELKAKLITEEDVKNDERLGPHLCFSVYIQVEIQTVTDYGVVLVITTFTYELSYTICI